MLEQDLGRAGPGGRVPSRVTRVPSISTSAQHKHTASRRSAVEPREAPLLFDWINKQIDPIDFRTLFELFVIHDFHDLEGNLLGRFMQSPDKRIGKIVDWGSSGATPRN
jgi:hypothetical protein